MLFSTISMMQVVQRFRQKAQAEKDPNWQNACKDKDLVVVIKPTDDATYKNTVDMLDEMTINDVKRYAMVDLFPMQKMN